jgi:hypothetical protein
VLPVYAHHNWQVEEVLVDRGDGVRACWEIRHDGDSMLCDSRAEANVLLAGYGFNLSQLAALDTVDDGCE